MAASLEHRVTRLESQAEIVESVAVLIYRNPADLDTMMSRTTAPIRLCIPDNHRDEETTR